MDCLSVLHYFLVTFVCFVSITINPLFVASINSTPSDLDLSICHHVTSLFPDSFVLDGDIQGKVVGDSSKNRLSMICNEMIANPSTSSNHLTLSFSDPSLSPVIPSPLSISDYISMPFLPPGIQVKGVSTKLSFHATIAQIQIPIKGGQTETTSSSPLSSLVSQQLLNFSYSYQIQVKLSGESSVIEAVHEYDQIEEVMQISNSEINIIIQSSANSIPIGFVCYTPLAYQARLETPFSSSASLIDLFIWDPDLSNGVHPVIIFKAAPLRSPFSESQLRLLKSAQSIIDVAANVNAFLGSKSASFASLKSSIRGGFLSSKNLLPLSNSPSSQESVASSNWKDSNSGVIAVQGYLYVSPNPDKSVVTKALATVTPPAQSLINSVYYGVYASTRISISSSSSSYTPLKSKNSNAIIQKIVNEVADNRCKFPTSLSDSVVTTLAASIYIDESRAHVLETSATVHGVGVCFVDSPAERSDSSSSHSLSSDKAGVIGLQVSTSRSPVMNLIPSLILKDNRALTGVFKGNNLVSQGYLWSYIPSDSTSAQSPADSSFSLNQLKPAWTSSRLNLGSANGGGRLFMDRVLSESSDTAIISFIQKLFGSITDIIDHQYPQLSTLDFLKGQVNADLNPGRAPNLLKAYYEKYQSSSCIRKTLAGLLFFIAEQTPAFTIRTVPNNSSAAPNESTTTTTTTTTTPSPNTAAPSALQFDGLEFILQLRYSVMEQTIDANDNSALYSALASKLDVSSTIIPSMVKSLMVKDQMQIDFRVSLLSSDMQSSKSMESHSPLKVDVFRKYSADSSTNNGDTPAATVLLSKGSLAGLSTGTLEGSSGCTKFSRDDPTGAINTRPCPMRTLNTNFVPDKVKSFEIYTNIDDKLDKLRLTQSDIGKYTAIRIKEIPETFMVRFELTDPNGIDMKTVKILYQNNEIKYSPDLPFTASFELGLGRNQIIQLKLGDDIATQVSIDRICPARFGVAPNTVSPYCIPCSGGYYSDGDSLEACKKCPSGLVSPYSPYGYTHCFDLTPQGKDNGDDICPESCCASASTKSMKSIEGNDPLHHSFHSSEYWTWKDGVAIAGGENAHRAFRDWGAFGNIDAMNEITTSHRRGFPLAANQVLRRPSQCPLAANYCLLNPLGAAGALGADAGGVLYLPPPAGAPRPSWEYFSGSYTETYCRLRGTPGWTQAAAPAWGTRVNDFITRLQVIAAADADAIRREWRTMAMSEVSSLNTNKEEESRNTLFFNVLLKRVLSHYNPTLDPNPLVAAGAATRLPQSLIIYDDAGVDTLIRNRSPVGFFAESQFDFAMYPRNAGSKVPLNLFETQDPRVQQNLGAGPNSVVLPGNTEPVFGRFSRGYYFEITKTVYDDLPDVGGEDGNGWITPPYAKSRKRDRSGNLKYYVKVEGENIPYYTGGYPDFVISGSSITVDAATATIPNDGIQRFTNGVNQYSNPMIIVEMKPEVNFVRPADVRDAMMQVKMELMAQYTELTRIGYDGIYDLPLCAVLTDSFQALFICLDGVDADGKGIFVQRPHPTNPTWRLPFEEDRYVLQQDNGETPADGRARDLEEFLIQFHDLLSASYYKLLHRGNFIPGFAGIGAPPPAPAGGWTACHFGGFPF